MSRLSRGRWWWLAWAFALLLAAALPAGAQEAPPPSPGPTLDLHEALRRALDSSPDLDELRARIAEARYRVDETYVQVTPSLSLGGTYTRLTPTLSFVQGGRQVTVNAADNYNVGLTLTQALYTFGRLKWQSEAAELTARQARESYRTALEGLMEQVARAYVEALLASEQVRIAESLVASRKAHLEESQRLYKAGVVARFDVLRNSSELSRSQQVLLVATSGRQLAVASLRTLMGEPPETADPPPLDLAPLPHFPPPPPAEGYGGSLERAMARRPEMTALQWAVEAARARVKAAETEDNPTLALQSTASQRNATGFANGEQWSTSVNLTVPLFDGGSSRIRADQAREVVSQLEASLRAVVRSVALDVQSTYIELTNRWEQIDVARRNLDQADEAFRVARVRYSAGISTNVELLDAETAAAQARLDLARARADYASAYAGWKRAISAEYPVEVPGPVAPPEEQAPEGATAPPTPDTAKDEP